LIRNLRGTTAAAAPHAAGANDAHTHTDTPIHIQPCSCALNQLNETWIKAEVA